MRPASFLAALVIAMLAAGHLFRLVFRVPVSIGDFLVPMWVSPFATVVLAAIVFGLWRENRAAPQGK